ncbi:MAG: thiamine phosphate synthase [Gemmatimonadaceae bacterium]|nr:thiamine phosphate synthase [Gemmatimonadaceae bacterium]
MFSRDMVRLIAITDGLHGNATDLVSRAVQAAEGGATMIQLRLKEVSARELAEVARAMMLEIAVPLIINDRADVAIAVGAAGCHLGADDVPVSAVRKLAPAGFIIGCSVGADPEVAAAEGADYAGIGPVFTTSTKADAGKAIGVEGFKLLSAKLSIPAVGIGGISADNARSVIDAGGAGVAAVSAIFGALDVKSSSTSIFRAIEK